MFVFLFNDTNETEFFFDFSVDFSVHVEELLWGFAVSERFFEELLDFPADSFELFAFVDFGHGFGEDVDSGFFEDTGWG
jgi:hypothetical protein